MGNKKKGVASTEVPRGSEDDDDRARVKGRPEPTPRYLEISRTTKVTNPDLARINASHESGGYPSVMTVNKA